MALKSNCLLSPEGNLGESSAPVHNEFTSFPKLSVGGSEALSPKALGTPVITPKAPTPSADWPNAAALVANNNIVKIQTFPL
jgi:hypothetical protein